MKKILIVDDLRPFIEKERNILNRADFHLLTAASGEDALEIVKKEHVDLILTDLNMPGMNGDDLSKAIRNDDALKRVSIIIVCSNKESDMERCAASGANEVITRPLDARKLIEKATMLLNVPKRKHLRVLMKVVVNGNFRSEPFFCTTHNISTSGILLESERTLSKGDTITCSFFIPGSERIEVEGAVKRVERQGKGSFLYGVRFIGLGPDKERIVDEYVKKKANSR
jgi:CheY-like chemotaxis protein